MNLHVTPAAPKADPRPPAFSDESLALAFAQRHADDLRYVAAWGRWLSWTGTHWRFDETLDAFDRARAICRDAAAACNKAKIASVIASAKTVAAVERLAKADRRLAATIDQWDADPWLLNTPGGFVDLRTGDCRPARPSDHFTKITDVAPDERAECPIFFAFLEKITGGDQDLIAYLRRVFGYALTGDTREHALFFAYGTGANGKSVLLSTIAGILGDYHKTAAIETFTASNTDRHPTDLAGLRGARLVTAIETEEPVPPGDLYDKAFGGNYSNADQPTFRKLPESLTELEHQQYAPSLRDRLGLLIAAARDSYVAGFAP
jgi:putative DNA primase/helicase